MSGGEPTEADPAGPLVVSAGGILVASDGLLHHLDRLAALSESLREVGARLAAIDAAVDWRGRPQVSATAVATEARLDDLRAAVRAAGEHTDVIRHGVRAVLSAYLVTETVIASAAQSLGGVLAAELGIGLRAIAPFALAVLPGVAIAGASGWILLPGGDARGKLATLQRLIVRHPRLVTSTAFVRLVRATAMHLDAAAMAYAGVPVPLAGVLGDQRLGGAGARGNALGVLAVAGAVGLLRESAVRIEPRTIAPAVPTAPSGAADRLARVPEVDQVRIERYDAPDRPARFVVYVGPTETFTPLPTEEPWDLASNVAGVAGASGGSFRATELAMRDAGITADSEVQFVGFSQGGLVAAMLAGSGEWTATGLETYAAPTGGIALPDGMPGLDVRHADDFVPAFAGEDLPSDRVRVEREAFAQGEPPDHLAAPAHQKVTYQATAEAIDAAQSSVVRDQLAAMRAFTEEYTGAPGSTITVLGYHAERVWEPSGSPGSEGLSSSGRGAAGAAARGR